MVKDDAQSFFVSNQVGVAGPFGVEAAVNSIRAWARTYDTNNKIRLNEILPILFN